MLPSNLGFARARRRYVRAFASPRASSARRVSFGSFPDVSGNVDEPFSFAPGVAIAN
jgi:hypothetical protein